MVFCTGWHLVFQCCSSYYFEYRMISLSGQYIRPIYWSTFCCVDVENVRLILELLFVCLNNAFSVSDVKVMIDCLSPR